MKWIFLFAVALAGADFDRDVRPLLTAKCVKCHQGTGAFDMTAGVAGVVVKGDPAASKLYQHVASGKMPMGGPRLSVEEVALIGEWIRGGAGWGSNLEVAPKKTWWAFVPPVKAAGSTDSFLLAKLQAFRVAQTAAARAMTLPPA